MNRRIVSALAGVSLSLLLCACGAVPAQESEATHTPTAATEEPKEAVAEPAATEDRTEEEETQMLQMKIGETAVAVEWEENESVEALKALCREKPLTISLSMYGGFEQVGPIGTSLPRADKQTTTEAGDIVLYSGNQFVVFYGSNSWSYTRLGHISDQSAADMEALLGHGDVTLSLRLEAEG